MSDDLDDLKAAFDAATPAPDTARRAETMALARKNFEALQGTRPAARLKPDASSNWGFGRGVRNMLNAMSSKAGLAGATGLAAVALIAVVPVMRQGLAPEAEIPHAPVQVLMEPSLDLADSRVIVEDLAMPEPRLMVKAAPVPASARAQGYALDSAAPVLAPEPPVERFANEAESGVKVTAEAPVSTFSIDVDTASYALVRSSLNRGALPPKDAVRIEEMVNYFSYSYPAPEGDAPFAASLAMMQTPWNAGTQILRIALQGKTPAIEARPPLDLVFLVDTSGSMRDANKLPLLKQSLRLLLPKLRAEDQIALVTYAGTAGVALPPTSAQDSGAILAALEGLDAAGSTNGQAGLKQAYALARQMQDEGDVSRVILATDGDFNVGLDDPEALKDFIADQRDSGVFLSVLGFGRGTLDDAVVQSLAQNGNGQAAYIDTMSEAQKVLVDQVTGALFPIANDVKVQVEFNPARVAEYRLIGYETRALAREDFNNDAVDAGEIGAGHQVTALYEITPVGSGSRLTDPLRYAEAPAAKGNDELGYLKLRYKEPGGSESQLTELPIPAQLQSDEDLRFASAVAGFGAALRGSRYLGEWGIFEAQTLARGARGEDPFGYRGEAIRLMQLAGGMEK